jgi:hypothetical protein
MREQEQEYKYRHQLSPPPLAKCFDDSCLCYLLNQALLLPTISLHSDESHFGDCCQKKLRHLSRPDVTSITSERFILKNSYSKRHSSFQRHETSNILAKAK